MFIVVVKGDWDGWMDKWMDDCTTECNTEPYTAAGGSCELGYGKGSAVGVVLYCSKQLMNVPGYDWGWGDMGGERKGALSMVVFNGTHNCCLD